MTKKFLHCVIMLLAGNAVAQEWERVAGTTTLFEIETTIKSITVQVEPLTPHYEIQIGNSTAGAGICPDSDSVYIESEDLEMLDSAKLAQALNLSVIVVVDDSKHRVVSTRGTTRCTLVGITVLTDEDE